MAQKPEMSKREMNLRIFRGDEVPGVFFQPRMEPWWAWHRATGGLPGRYRGMGLMEIYDDLGLSMRYVHYYTGMPDPVRKHYSEEVKVRRQEEDGDATVTIETPYGPLVRRERFSVDKVWRTVEWPVKGADDFPKLKWLLENTDFSFSPENFERGSGFLADRGEPQFWLPKSPYQALCQTYMKLEDVVYALVDVPAMVEEVMELVDRGYDPLYRQLVDYGGVRIVNFGENIHDSLLSPAYFEKYLIPWYEKRSGQLRDAGIFTHVHIDGYFHSLLPFLADLPFDGLEALTPRPQGDVTLEEIKQHIGDKVLLDGIPAILFLPHYPEERLRNCVERIVELFHPRLVLGISDELPEGVGEDGVERVRWVSEYCRDSA
jgi:hypothetical protein